MTPFEQLAIHHILAKAGVANSPLIEQTLLRLLHSAQEGHLCCHLEEDLPNTLFEKGVLIRHQSRLYFQKNWELESQVIKKITELWQRPIPPFDPVRFQAALEAEKWRLNAAQFAAITNGFEKRLTLFSGGPGTGKTYTAAAFIRLCVASMDRCKVIITAPTGKAAAHLESHVAYESMTLHRLLKLRPNMQKLQSQSFVDADLIVVDEASMMDGWLLLHLLNAIGPNTRLLLLGDANQLPPVEGYSFFPDLAHLFGQKLTHSMRTKETALRQIGDDILEGNGTNIPRLPWFSKAEPLAHWLCQKLPTLTTEDPALLLQELTRFRILSALRQGPFGVDALNQTIYAHVKNRNPWFPILINQNSPSQELYNGTTGVFVRGKAYFLINGEIKAFPEKMLPQYEMAFCLSIHKSQGSEFDHVLVLFGPGSERFGKEALYTAVTRAKKSVEICADETSFQLALRKKTNLHSGFRERVFIDAI